MIYLFDDMENIPVEIINKTLTLMPPERQQRAMRYRHEIDKNLCVLAYKLLMLGLKQEYGITKPLAFNYCENRKPYLSNYPDIYFNISHCKYGAVCAISDKEVGIDIQDVRPFDFDVAKRVCSDSEMGQFFKCHMPERLFCKIWTIKESFVKHFGGSIAQSLKSLDARSLCEQSNGYMASYWGSKYHVCCFWEHEINKVQLQEGKMP
jgi:4'-phosphopantetheinyl transferase